MLMRALVLVAVAFVLYSCAPSVFDRGDSVPRVAADSSGWETGNAHESVLGGEGREASLGRGLAPLLAEFDAVATGPGVRGSQGTEGEAAASPELIADRNGPREALESRGRAADPKGSRSAKSGSLTLPLGDGTFLTLPDPGSTIALPQPGKPDFAVIDPLGEHSMRVIERERGIDEIRFILVPTEPFPMGR